MAKADKPNKPKSRHLRAFAFDPSLTVQFATSAVNEVAIDIPWNFDDDGNAITDRTHDGWLVEGPENEYLKVVDFDPASGAIYPPVDLNQQVLIYEGGWAPSEKNPQFHQQMVFAVAMKTIRHFETALGRTAFWAPRTLRNARGDVTESIPVPQLRIYPHGLRDRNAFYSPTTSALHFGYFTATGTEPSSESNASAQPDSPSLQKQLPRVGMVYTCLAHGIVAHETTHALLDGVHPGFMHPTNPDVDAFHEAFADIVALFQHFTYSSLLRHQIAKTRGDLRKQNLLGMLAYDFGRATGRGGALRDALGSIDPKTGEWQPKTPDHTEMERTFEPHKRGAIFVAAVFDAYRVIYESRCLDLLRIATGGTGILPEGAIHPDLVERLTTEATKTAEHFLNLCIRAIDYCPPVDINFGDYMRAMITADYDFCPIDERNYRTAIIESFRKYGIYPRDVRSLLIDAIMWLPPTNVDKSKWAEAAEKIEAAYERSKKGKNRRAKPATERNRLIVDWDLNTKRIKRYLTSYGRKKSDAKHDAKYWSKALYLALDPQTLSKELLSVCRRGKNPLFHVQSVRYARRVGDAGAIKNDLVVQVVQNRKGYFDPSVQQQVDEKGRGPKPDFIFPAGCTMILDAETKTPRFVIAKSVWGNRRLEDVRAYLQCQQQIEAALGSLQNTYFGIARRELQQDEPFALLHRMSDEAEVAPWH